MPKRIQRSRDKGWRMPENAVYVGRPTIFGNPFPLSYCTRQQSVALFRHALGVVWSGPYIYELVGGADSFAHADYQMWRRRFGSIGPVEMICEQLRGKDLACWCPLVDKYGNHVLCHADVLLELANQ